MTIPYLCGALLCVCLLFPSSSAQASELAPLVTDHTPMGLTANFGLPGIRVVNQNGDYAFVGENGTAIFFLSHTAASGSTPARVLQFGLGLDDSGDFAFLATGGFDIVPNGNLYIAMSGNSPAPVASLSQAAPGTNGTFAGFIQRNINPLIPPSFNNSGQLLMAANISGGAGGVGLFVFSTAGVRKVVANGDANPLGGLFTLSSNTAWAVFNNQGQVAFIAGNPAGSPAGNSLFINSPTSATSGTTAVVAAAGSAAPASLGRTMSFVQTLQPSVGFYLGWLGLDDNGDIVVVSQLSGSRVTNQALLRFIATPANSTAYTTQVVAYGNETAPGVPGEVFSLFQNASINNSGLVTFASQLRNTSPPRSGNDCRGNFPTTRRWRRFRGGPQWRGGEWPPGRRQFSVVHAGPNRVAG